MCPRSRYPTDHITDVSPIVAGSEGTSLAEKGTSDEGEWGAHAHLLAKLRLNKPLSSQLCFYDRGTHTLVSEMSHEYLDMLDGKHPDQLSELYSLSRAADRCPLDRFPTLSTCYPDHDPESEEMKVISGLLDMIEECRGTAVGMFALKSAPNLKLKAIRSHIWNLCESALDPSHGYTNGSSMKASALSMDQRQFLVNSEEARELRRAVEDVLSRRLGEEWYAFRAL